MFSDSPQGEDWQGGAPRPPAFPIDRTPEAEEAQAQWAIISPPLLGASRERLDACQMAIAMTLLDAEVGLVEATRLSRLLVVRLQEPLE